MTEHVCVSCAAKRQTARDRLPRGWKDAGGPICPACLKAGWSTRAVSLPVRAVLDPESGESVDFWPPFLAAWRLSTALANWAVAELIRADVRRSPEMERLPPPPKLNLYTHWNAIAPVAVRQLWDGCAGSAAAILRAVDDVWKHHPRMGRFSVIWHSEARGATYRFPYPWVVRAQEMRVSWHARPDGQREPRLSVTIPGGRALLRLDWGSCHCRALEDFGRLVTGQALLGDVKLVGQCRGGKLKGVMARIVGRFRRTGAKPNGDRTVTVRTDAAALLVADVPGRESWVLNHNSIAGALAAVRRYEEARARFATDTKYEKRWPAARRHAFLKAQKVRMRTEHDRLRSLVQQAAAQTVAYVVRSGCAAVRYDDGVRSFVDPFPWQALRDRLRSDCLERGISFEHVATAGDATE